MKKEKKTTEKAGSITRLVCNMVADGIILQQRSLLPFPPALWKKFTFPPHPYGPGLMSCFGQKNMSRNDRGHFQEEALRRTAHFFQASWDSAFMRRACSRNEKIHGTQPSPTEPQTTCRLPADIHTLSHEIWELFGVLAKHNGSLSLSFNYTFFYTDGCMK